MSRVNVLTQLLVTHFGLLEFCSVFGPEKTTALEKALEKYVMQQCNVTNLSSSLPQTEELYCFWLSMHRLF